MMVQVSLAVQSNVQAFSPLHFRFSRVALEDPDNLAGLMENEMEDSDDGEDTGNREGWQETEQGVRRGERRSSAESDFEEGQRPIWFSMPAGISNPMGLRKVERSASTDQSHCYLVARPCAEIFHPRYNFARVPLAPSWLLRSIRPKLTPRSTYPPPARILPPPSEVPAHDTTWKQPCSSCSAHLSLAVATFAPTLGRRSSSIPLC